MVRSPQGQLGQERHTHMLRPLRVSNQVSGEKWLSIQLRCDPMTSGGHRRDSIMMVYKFKLNLLGTQ